MKEEITEILNILLSHEITKGEAAILLERKALVTSLGSDKKAALNYAVSALYFDDNSDYKSALYGVVAALVGESVNSDGINDLFKELNPED